MALTRRTLVEYLVFLVPLYLLVGAPIRRALFGDPTIPEEGRRVGFQNAAEIPASLLESLALPDPDLQCPEHAYKARIYSRDPLVVYLEGFLSEEERRHVVDISTPHFRPSTTFTGATEHLDASVRLSEKALLNRTTTVRCIEARARALQGWRPHVFVEKLWAQRYAVGGHYAHHYDWGVALAAGRGGRVSSFMVYVACDGCVGGGTSFPRLEGPGEGGESEGKGEWCGVVECGGKGSGTTFKPVAGNAVYWENFDKDGRGYAESWHAGLPVEEGTKIGMNIWSWYQPGFRPPLGNEKEPRQDSKVKE